MGTVPRLICLCHRLVPLQWSSNSIKLQNYNYCAYHCNMQKKKSFRAAGNNLPGRIAICYAFFFIGMLYFCVAFFLHRSVQSCLEYLSFDWIQFEEENYSLCSTNMCLGTNNALPLMEVLLGGTCTYQLSFSLLCVKPYYHSVFHDWTFKEFYFWYYFCDTI